jgi:cell wall-associated NlpC family hydrolase
LQLLQIKLIYMKIKKWMKKKAKISQSDCGYFASTCVRAAGLGNFLALPGKASQPYPSLPGTLKIVHKGTIGTFKLKAGDIIRYRKTNKHQHVVVYIGDGKIAHAGRGHWFPKVTANKPWNNSNVKQSTIQVIRAK